MSAEATGFPIHRPTLSRGGLDRSGLLRSPERIPTFWPAAALITVDPRGRVAVTDTRTGPELVMTSAHELGDAPPPAAVMLGRGEVRVAGGPRAAADIWAVPGFEDFPDHTSGAGHDVAAAAGAGSRAADLREVGALLDDVDAAVLTTAVALLSWHRTHPFCPRCGEQGQPTAAGWSRTCPRGHEQFPRTDPAVIMLIHDGAGSMVLARQSVWAPGRMSVLAGFVEAGESLEATVLREVGEEVGLLVTDPVYLGSQPWPFPRSLMVGFAARAVPGAPFALRDGEIESAQWISRARVRELIAAEVEHEPAGDWWVLPGPVSIARRMIEGWAAVGPD